MAFWGWSVNHSLLNISSLQRFNKNYILQSYKFMDDWEVSYLSTNDCTFRPSTGLNIVVQYELGDLIR